MNRITLAFGTLTISAVLALFALSPAAHGETIGSTAFVVPANPADSALTALLADNLMLRVAVDNNDAAKAGVPCADLGADSASCVTGRLILVNSGQTRITGDGWKLYLHSIRRLLKIDHPDFSLRHLTGDLYELTPRAGAVALAANERVELPFVAEYWLLRYSDLLPRPYIVVAGVSSAVLKHNDTDDETRYVEALPDNKTDIPITPAQKFRQMVERGEPLPPQDVAARVLPSVIRTHEGEGQVDVRGVELSLPDLSPASLAALRERANTLGLGTRGLRITGVLAPDSLAADIMTPGGYTMGIERTGVVIEAYDAAGLYYGVQTLLSLTPAGGGRIPAMIIDDAPRYEHRGMMVDLARNFRQPATLRRLIDQMSAYKLNRLHLHLSDDEGWRIEIPGLPELTAIGARRCHDPEETRCLLPQLASGPDNSSGGG
jgi:hexosaminidase